jgi:hypothetical protein
MSTTAVEIARQICDRRGPETVAEQVERATKLIEAEIAQATAEALEAAADECEGTQREGKWFKDEKRTPVQIYNGDAVCECADNIRALIPADIAAKAKEHDAALFAQWRNRALELLDEQRSIWGNGTYSAPEILDAVEKDLRADKEFSRSSEGPDLIEAIRESGGTGHTEAPEQREHDAKIRREAYLRCADYVGVPSGTGHCAALFRKWANEADGGG